MCDAPLLASAATAAAAAAPPLERTTSALPRRRLLLPPSSQRRSPALHAMQPDHGAMPQSAPPPAAPSELILSPRRRGMPPRPPTLRPSPSQPRQLRQQEAATSSVAAAVRVANGYPRGIYLRRRTAERFAAVGRAVERPGQQGAVRSHWKLRDDHAVRQSAAASQGAARGLPTATPWLQAILHHVLGTPPAPWLTEVYRKLLGLQQ